MNIEEKQRGLAMGIYMAGTKIGPAVGAPSLPSDCGYGWRAMFFVTGLASRVWLIPWLLSFHGMHRRSRVPAVAQSRRSVFAGFRSRRQSGVF